MVAIIEERGCVMASERLVETNVDINTALE